MVSDVLIIGAGISGLLTGLFLRRKGIQVTIIDQGDIARESTWAGAGILSSLLPWNYGGAVNMLVERGRRMWPALAAELAEETGIDPEYWACGMLVLAPEKPKEAKAWCHDHGWEFTEPAPAGVLRHCHSQLADRHSLWLPEVAQARNPRIARALETACRQAGISIHPRTAVTHLEFANGIVEYAHSKAGNITARHYVVAAGAWSNTCLGERALGVSIEPVRGQILLYETGPGELTCTVYHGGKYIVPRKDGHVLVGSTLETVGFDKHNTEAACQELQAFALDTIPNLARAKLVRQWAGLRPGSKDNVPTISRHPEIGNLFINSGHFRYGVTMGPAAAEMLAEIITDQPTTLDATAYGWPRD